MNRRASFSDTSAGDGNLMREIRQITLGASPGKVQSETHNEKVSSTSFTDVYYVYYAHFILQRGRFCRMFARNLALFIFSYEDTKSLLIPKINVVLASPNESSTSLDYESGSDSGNDVSTRLNSKQQLAMTIRNWTTMPENDKSVITEGGVLTLIKLASIDDIIVKKCCASGFYHLSSRERNRHNLVQLGVVTGVIAISTQVRSWNIAKLCAMCLCNLSIEPEGESIMAKEGSFELIISDSVNDILRRLISLCYHEILVPFDKLEHL